jgi:hypothetical protein
MAGRRSKAGREGWTGFKPNVPFTAGNDVATTHGAYKDGVVVPQAVDMAEELLTPEGTPDYLRNPMFGPAVRRWAVAEVRAMKAGEWVDQMGMEAAMTPPKPGTAAPIETVRKMEAHAGNQADKLGLTPASHAKLIGNVAGAQVDVARLMQAEQEKMQAEAEDQEDCA